MQAKRSNVHPSKEEREEKMGKEHFGKGRRPRWRHVGRNRREAYFAAKERYVSEENTRSAAAGETGLWGIKENKVQIHFAGKQQ